ncbi:DUF389 domain-containing protein [Rudaeicoccus suwonensis]|uniref:Putative hydrophobic protein (TIGR00271 family) n=1 Tax=Rudaeicoccus suwonensis TaxID=657409 RepID=A0A561E0Z6_9MICO|nr:DUF389 domain-containing protein [Rudaeicoccus suwonensis]TWE09305.1 putative hydrophobic protein (TIGR00271 family) [Rudaeicoccus suwonensis]
MLVHLRLTTPPDLTGLLGDLLNDNEAVTNVSVQRGIATKPRGDVLEADVAREAASTLLDEIERTGLAERGGINVSSLTATPYRAASMIDRLAIGEPDDAVIWAQIEEQAEAGARSTLSYYLFLIIAVALAAVAVVTDSPVLVVGAMVVGPEFATVASLCTALVLRNWGLVARSLILLVTAFAVAVLVITALALIGRAFGQITAGDVTRPRPETSFIWQPNIWSFIVAILAGAAGVLALSTDKAQAMVGVFISVTTVPAAGNFALALAVWAPREMGGSAAQLGINLVGMTIAGAVVLLVQRRWWHHLNRITAHVRP